LRIPENWLQKQKFRKIERSKLKTIHCHQSKFRFFLEKFFVENLKKLDLKIAKKIRDPNNLAKEVKSKRLTEGLISTIFCAKEVSLFFFDIKSNWAK